MKTATMILAAGFLSVSATAHAQGVAPGATGAPPATPSAANQTALMNSIATMMPQMSGPQLDLMLAEIAAKMKAEASVTNQQLDAARSNPAASNPDVMQAKLDTLQRLQTQTNTAKDLLAIKSQGSAAAAAPAIPAGMTQTQYQQLMRAQQGEAQDLQKILSNQQVMTLMAGLQSMQKARMDQDAVARPSPQQGQARQQLDNMLRQGVRTEQQKQQAQQLLKQSQWQPPAAPGVALTAQQQAQLAAMVTPQHQALLTALSQAQAQLDAARAKQADAQNQLRLLQSQIGPSTIVALAPKITQAQRAINDASLATSLAQQKATLAQQQAAPALQAVSAQAAMAAQMRAQRAQMTPAQLAEEKAQQEREAALLRKQQLQVAQAQVPIVQQQLKNAQEQLPVRQKAAAQQVEQLKADQQKQLADAQARIDNLQKMPPSTPGLQQQMQAAGQQMGGLQRQQQQQLQGMQQAQYQDQLSQQKNVSSLQQTLASLQQQINSLQAQQAQASTPSLPPEMQKVLDTMLAGSTTQIDQVLQALLAQANQMNSIMSQTQLRP
jgi:hypothetical protein